MKIGEAAKRTGLTEKAIRVYVDNGLVHPQVESGIHRNSYEFTQQNVQELERISVFRKAGFSIFEISIILKQPEKLPELVASKRQSMELDAEIRKDVHAALARLQASEVGDPRAVAASLRPAVEGKKATTEKGSRRWTIVTIILVVLAGAYLWLHNIGIYYSVHGWIPLRPDQELTIGGLLCLVIAMPALIMSWRYATCGRRSAKLPRHGTGTVSAILEEHSFDGRFARAGSGGAGTREPGIGGTWQIRFMLWNEVRPDCWFPVIRYTDENGKDRSNSFQYGDFKNTWRIGETVELAWDPKYPGYIHPMGGQWLKKKARIYVITGLVFLIAGIVLLSLAIPSFGEYAQPVIK